MSGPGHVDQRAEGVLPLHLAKVDLDPCIASPSQSPRAKDTPFMLLMRSGKGAANSVSCE